MRYLLLCASLAGCGLSPEFQQSKQEAEMNRHASSCSKLGIAQGTREHQECVLRLFESSRGASVNVRSN